MDKWLPAKEPGNHIPKVLDLMYHNGHVWPVGNNNQILPKLRREEEVAADAALTLAEPRAPVHAQPCVKPPPRASPTAATFWRARSTP